MKLTALIFFFLLALFCKDQRDRIYAKKRNISHLILNIRRPWTVRFFSWYNHNLWKDRHPLIKYILTMLLDGWHWNEFFLMLSLWLLVGILYADSLFFGISFGFSLSILFGASFSWMHRQ